MAKMQQAGEYGDHCTLQAVAEITKQRFKVYTGSAEESWMEVAPSTGSNFHSIALAFMPEHHYDAVEVVPLAPSSLLLFVLPLASSCFFLSFLLHFLSFLLNPLVIPLALLSLSPQTPVAPVIAADKPEAEEEDPPLALVAAEEEDPPAGQKRKRQEDAGLQKKPATSRAAGYDLRNQELPKRRLACKKATFLFFVLCFIVDILSFLRFLLVLPLPLSCHFYLCLLPVLSSWARSATKKPSSQAKRTGSYAQSRAARLTAAAIRMSCGSPRRKGCIGRASGGS